MGTIYRPDIPKQRSWVRLWSTADHMGTEASPYPPWKAVTQLSCKGAQRTPEAAPHHIGASHEWEDCGKVRQSLVLRKRSPS